MCLLERYACYPTQEKHSANMLHRQSEKFVWQPAMRIPSPLIQKIFMLTDTPNGRRPTSPLCLLQLPTQNPPLKSLKLPPYAPNIVFPSSHFLVDLP